MALESGRGAARHGSCGMGINECDLRGKAGYALTIGELLSLSAAEITNKLARLRREYLPRRLKELGLTPADLGEYGELLQDDNVLKNYAQGLLKNIPLITPAPDMKELFATYERVIFEHGQGLLLDSDNEPFWPHVTASYTGLKNPQNLLAEMGAQIDEAIYVTRTYVTRHGAGFLPHECQPKDLGLSGFDETNIPNSWQGCLRFAPHGSLEDFIAPVLKDAKAPKSRALGLTHLNETSGKVLFKEAAIPWQDFINLREIKDIFSKIYLSFSPFAVEKISAVPK